MTRLWRHGRLRCLGADVAGLALGAALLAGVLLSTPAAAGAASATASLSLSAQPAPHGRSGVELIARLAVPSGMGTRPRSAGLAGVRVRFSVHVAEFSGAPLLSLGSASTDAAGEATFTYQPTWTGRQAFVANAKSPSGTALTKTTTSVVARATDPFAGSIEASRPDAMIGRWVVVVLLTTLVALWITLFAVVVRVHRRAPPSSG
jgi:hypothetical protein